MTPIRALLRDHARQAVLLLALVLVAKALVPAGFMLDSGSQVLTISVCADAQGGNYTKQIVVPHSGKSDNGSTKAKGDCAWSVLAFAATAAAAAPLLVVALLFILALGFAATALPRLAQQPHVRPPLRGPPAPV